MVPLWRKLMIPGTLLGLPTTICLQFTNTTPNCSQQCVACFNLNIAMKWFVDIKKISINHYIS